MLGRNDRLADIVVDEFAEFVGMLRRKVIRAVKTGDRRDEESAVEYVRKYIREQVERYRRGVDVEYSTPLAEILPLRLANSLEAAGYLTAGSVSAVSQEQLMEEVENFGEVAASLLEERLGEFAPRSGRKVLNGRGKAKPGRLDLSIQE